MMEFVGFPPWQMSQRTDSGIRLGHFVLYGVWLLVAVRSSCLNLFRVGGTSAHRGKVPLSAEQ
jgi:hypothetical protein